MNAFSILFLTALTASFAVEFYLARRQARHVARHRAQVPQAFADTVPLAAHQKAADYTLAKGRLADIDRVVGVVALLALTLGGGVDWAFRAWGGWLPSPLWSGVGAAATVFLILSVVELPVHAYQTFAIEARFGFNHTTVRQFVKDQLLQLALAAALGLPLLALMLVVMDSLGGWWWLWAWALLMGFSVLMSWLFPTLIAPLFNTFTPLADGPLKTRIQGLLARCGFQSNGIFIMDGSKRSGHGNAYFTGLGNHKRIVFFDTLVQALADDELEAVLAHELGHFKRKHTLKMLAATALMSLLGFAVLGWLIDKPWFFEGLGVGQPSPAAALVLFTLVSSTFGFFMQPVSAYWQRRFEFEADRFAATHASADKLVSGLVKLYKENASTLTPDPWYSAFYYSHPPAAVRIAHLRS